MTVRDGGTLECNAAPCDTLYTGSPATAADNETLRLEAAAGPGWRSIWVDIGQHGSVLIDLCEQHGGIFDRAWRHFSVEHAPINPLTRKEPTP